MIEIASVDAFFPFSFFHFSLFTFPLFGVWLADAYFPNGAKFMLGFFEAWI